MKNSYEAVSNSAFGDVGPDADAECEDEVKKGDPDLGPCPEGGFHYGRHIRWNHTLVCVKCHEILASGWPF